MRVRRGWVVAVAAVLAPVLIVVGVLRFRQTRVQQQRVRRSRETGSAAGSGEVAARVHGRTRCHPSPRRRRGGRSNSRRSTSASARSMSIGCTTSPTRISSRRMTRARGRRWPICCRVIPPSSISPTPALNLGGLYAAIADWRHAADAYDDVADERGRLQRRRERALERHRCAFRARRHRRAFSTTRATSPSRIRVRRRRCTPSN